MEQKGKNNLLRNCQVEIEKRTKPFKNNPAVKPATIEFKAQISGHLMATGKFAVFYVLCCFSSLHVLVPKKKKKKNKRKLSCKDVYLLLEQMESLSQFSVSTVGELEA